jgi:tetratricopeptide (TPR) repeat protein
MVQAEDRAKTRKQRADAAIQLALQGRWQDAADLNRSIIEAFPTDVDAYNRLGKALTELGRYADARQAYQKALEIDPLNAIAGKNLARLASLGVKAKRRQAAQKLAPQMFIEETGKTGATTLLKPNMGVAAAMTAGDVVELVRENGNLIVKSTQGERIGEVEPRLGQRLTKLIEAGNKYVAAISALTDKEVRVFLRETFQHPSQAGKLSFTPQVMEAFRPYVKERLVRKDSGDESYYESDEGDDWSPGRDSDEEGGATVSKYSRASLDDEEEEGEEADEEE